MSIESTLERLLEEADWKENREQRRSNISRGVFEAKRKQDLKHVNDLHPLRRRRLLWRDGMTVDELSERSTVSSSTITAIERRVERGSDATWRRLCLALGGCDRRTVDPHYVYVA